MNRTGLILAVLLIPACAALAAAQPPSLVADLNTEVFNGSAFPPSYDYWHQRMAELKGVVYFAATDPMHGQELWQSDGTPGAPGSSATSIPDPRAPISRL
jgi:hypothetical protein